MPTVTLTNQALSFLTPYLEYFESVSCPLCKKDDATVIGRNSRGGIQINTVICNTCTLIYLNPRLSQKKYKEFYATGDYLKFLQVVKGRKSEESDSKEESDHKFLRRKEAGCFIAKKYFKDFLSTRDIYFDIGCGFGGILAGVRDVCQCEIAGNEPALFCAEYAQKRLNAPIVQCAVEDLEQKEGEAYWHKCKLVSILSTLRHVDNPCLCLMVANKLLMEGGYLYIEVADLIRKMALTGKTLESFSTIDHPYNYHNYNLQYLLSMCGFSVVRFTYKSKTSSMMEVLARKEKGISTSIGCGPAQIIAQIISLDTSIRTARRSNWFSVVKFFHWAKKMKSRLCRAW